MKKNRTIIQSCIRSRAKTLFPEAWAEKFREARDGVQTAQNHFLLQRELADRSVWRDLGSACRVLFCRRRTILFFPERPPYRFAAYDACTFLGYRIVKRPHRKFDVAFKRSNATFFDDALLGAVPVEFARIINRESLDISKKTVGRVFGKVFGYELTVDPALYTGAMIEKSDVNGAHDGVIVQGPLPSAQIRDDRVYQKLVENRSFIDGYFLDYRVPIHGGVIPLVYLKHRPETQRFTVYEHTDFKKPEEVFGLDELDKICRLAAEMGLDYGEMDVLRDRDGRIYVVDVNNTPRNHTASLPVGRKRDSVECMAKTFQQLVERYA